MTTKADKLAEALRHIFACNSSLKGQGAEEARQWLVAYDIQVETQQAANPAVTCRVTDVDVLRSHAAMDKTLRSRGYDSPVSPSDDSLAAVRAALESFAATHPAAVEADRRDAVIPPCTHHDSQAVMAFVQKRIELLGMLDIGRTLDGSEVAWLRRLRDAIDAAIEQQGGAK